MRIENRGYTLIVVMLILVTLMIAGTAAIKMSGSELRTSIGHQRELMLSSCARSAREVLLGQLRFMGPIPERFSMEVTRPATGGDITVLRVEDGHVRDPDREIVSVEFITDAELGTARDPGLHPAVTNDILPPGGISGSAARIVARCEDRGGRMQEVEFLVRFGI